MAPRGSEISNMDRERERQKYKARLVTALNEEDDPLAVYHQFVQWTIKNYGENDPRSGLAELLKEATTQFKDDSLYKTDLRYLKLWALYARQMDKQGAIAIYSSLIASEIGTSYSALYEDYANLLEDDGRCVIVNRFCRHFAQPGSDGRRPMSYIETVSRSPPGH